MKSKCISMTGYANLEFSLGGNSYTLELKSYNSRYLDLSVKLPSDFTKYEQLIREEVKKNIQRGRVEVNLFFKKQAKEVNTVKKNIISLKKYFADLNLSVSDEFIYNQAIINPLEVQDNFKKIFIDKIQQAIIILVKNRESEGSKLKKFILERILKLKSGLSTCKKLGKFSAKNRVEKLKKRISELSIEKLPDLTSEILMLAQRHDISEEFDRLDSHLREFEKTITKASSGKKMDFICQEILRELNTISSKNDFLKISTYAIDSKVILEQIREQVQNIE